jgi:hypothetical protein
VPVRAIARRLNWLEKKYAPPQVNPESQRMADLILESRRRRLVDCGEAEAEPLAWPTLPLLSGNQLSCAEQIRIARLLIEQRGASSTAFQAARG